MIISEFEYITSSDAAILIDKHIAENPLQLALKGVSAHVCTQIKYLQRCQNKLPHYYNARCVIPSLSYEQSSSAATATAKDHSGNICLDLTCGLGADSYNFSKRFNKIITIERDELLSKVAAHNFIKLGAKNIEILNNSAEEFLKSYSGEKFDMIYIDPARRDHAKKVFLLEDCSPDMNIIMPLAVANTSKIVVKLSPMFDTDAAHTFFSKWGGVRVSSVSYDRECKEVLVEINTNGTDQTSCSTIIKSQTSITSYSYPHSTNQTYDTALTTEHPHKYLYIPNIAFYKNRTINNLLQCTYNCTDYYLSSPNSPILSNTKIKPFEGDTYTIEQILPYKPKELKKLFRSHGSKVKILKKEFPEKTELIKKELSISDGTSPIALFTNCRGRKEVFILSPF